MRTLASLSLASICLLTTAVAVADDKPADPPGQLDRDDKAFDPNSYSEGDKAKPKPDADKDAADKDAGDKDADDADDEDGKDKKKKKKAKDDGGEPEDGGRFRGGVSGAFGPFFPGPIYMFGADGRLGYQINDLMAVYGGFGAMAGFGFGIGSSDSSASVSISAGAAVALNAMFEITLADIFFVGLGPQLMYGSFVSESLYASTTKAGASVGVFAGPMGGIKARVGVGFGSHRDARRKQFTLAIDGNLIFGEQLTAVDEGGTSGATVLVKDGVGVGFLPMLSLGYDAK